MKKNGMVKVHRCRGKTTTYYFGGTMGTPLSSSKYGEDVTYFMNGVLESDLLI